MPPPTNAIPGLAAVLSPAANIDEVLLRLDALVVRTREAGSRLGYFAALYRRVTQQVAHGIAAGEFEDGPRMGRLDTNFANRYFAALLAFTNGTPAPSSWGVAFRAANDSQLIILQNLLLGINAHINLDLGAASAAICQGTSIEAIKNDFNRINAVLADLTDKVELCLGTVSPMIGALDDPAGNTDEQLAVFSIDIARDDAWRLAETLAALPAPFRPAVARLADEKAAMLGRLVAHPPLSVRAALGVVRASEVTDVRAVIDALTNY